jgi:hypothetical protein
MTQEGVPNSTVCKFVGTHAVCEDPKTRVANITYLLDRMRERWFIGIDTLFAQCDAANGMLPSWSRLGPVAIGFDTPMFSSEWQWLWANNAVCVKPGGSKDAIWLPMVSDIEHQAYAQSRIDKIDLLYLLSAPIPFRSPGSKEVLVHLNAIMVPHAVSMKASGDASCSILYSGLHGIECVEIGPKGQPLTGNIHLSGVESGALPTPTVYPGWRRNMYHSIVQRDQFMREWLDIITSKFGSGRVDVPDSSNPPRVSEAVGGKDRPDKGRGRGRGAGKNTKPPGSGNGKTGEGPPGSEESETKDGSSNPSK